MRILFLLAALAVISATLKADEYTFENDAPNSPPSGFSNLFVGKGAPGCWVVISDASAPSGKLVLTQTNIDATSYRFPLCISDFVSGDVEMSVKFKAISGLKDQAAGIIWRFQDTNNFYVARANALENNVVAYKMQDGKRTDLKPKGAAQSAYGVKIDVPPGQWHALAVRARGSVFDVLFNRKTIFQVEDTTFYKPGRAGLWTKADSLILFDDLKVTALK